MNKNLEIILLVVIGIVGILLLGSLAASKNNDLTEANNLITELQKENFELTLQNNHLAPENKALKTQLGRAQRNYAQDSKRYENRVNELLNGIDEIDKVNSDFEAYGESRFEEGFVKAVYGGCILSTGNLEYCLAGAKRVYHNRTWDENFPKWDDVWKVLRAMKGTES